MGPSQSKQEFFGTDVGIWRGEWRSVGGGESGWATPDTVDDNLVWSSASGSGSVGGIVTRYDVRTRNVHEVEVWPQSTTGTPADSVKYRFQWTFPLTVSPHDHNTVYVGSQVVHMTTDGGNTWNVISPDLTRNDKSKQKISGGLTPDNIGVEYGDVVFAIAESPITKGEIWAGTNDGLVQLTRDGGKTWTNVTANIPGMLQWGTVTTIEPSRYSDGTAFITVDGHQVNNRDPWVYRTTDFGKTWTLITRGIPKSPLSYAHVIREDPVRKGLLYLGTENGLYVSFDDGARVAAAAERSAARACVRDGDPAALPRSRRGDVRPWLLHPRRHHAARTVGAGNSVEGGRAAQAAGSISLPHDRRSVHRDG